MQVGSLVKNEEYGTLGIILEMLEEGGAYVSWLTTPNLDPLYRVWIHRYHHKAPL